MSIIDQEFANDMGKLFDGQSGARFDVIIYAGENENVKEIGAHSNILRARSIYFSAAFSDNWANKKDGKFIFRKPNISPLPFSIILRFIYCGTVDLAGLQGPVAFETLVAADELREEKLISDIQKYLIEYQYEFLHQDYIRILEIIHQHEAFAVLLNYFLQKVCRRPEILFNPDDKFVGLKEPFLEMLLKQDDLDLEEIVIWNSLIKWSFAQHPSIQHDVEKRNKEEMTIVERTLNKFIPLIRFCHISPDDLRVKISPFDEIIPKGLIDNIQPQRQSKFIADSVLIESEHFATLSCWIEIRNASYYNIGNIPYRFNLLYRASKDGNTAAEFRNKCDNKGTNIVVAKIKNSVQIVGGFNLHFNDKFNDRSDVFMFSFRSINIQEGQVGYGNHGRYTGFGPIFDGRSDLMCCTKWVGGPGSHPKVDGMPADVFYVDDYEVFQVIKV